MSCTLDSMFRIKNKEKRIKISGQKCSLFLCPFSSYKKQNIMSDFKNKTVIITGAAMGLGLSTAEVLA